MNRLLKLAACAAAIALSSTAAHASTWLLNYVAQDGGQPAAANLTLSASDAQNALGAFDVLGISGNVDGDLVAALISNPNQPNWSLSADGFFTFDNNLWPKTSPIVSNPGLFFSGKSGAEYNLFSVGQGYQLYKATPGVGIVSNSSGALSISGGVPEPAAWALMIGGFAGVGVMVRRRRAAAALAA